MTSADGGIVRRAAIALLSFDVVVIALHLVSGGAAVVNLDGEGNVPTWYSSAKLLAIAALAVVAWHAEGEERRAGLSPPPHRRLWLAIGGLFAALSLDETASLHERLARFAVSEGPAGRLRATVLGGDAAKDSFSWPILFAPVAVLVVTFLAAFAWTRRERLRRVLALGAAGVGCYAMAMVLEPAAVYFSPAMAAWGEEDLSRYRLFSAVEESCEIFGTSFLLLTALYYVALSGQRRRSAGPSPQGP